MKIKPLPPSLSFLCALLLGSLTPVHGADPLNVVLIVADDLGAHDLNTHGSDLHETPHLDAFAASGIEFTSAYAAAPICTPTRASIMTGKNPARLRMINLPVLKRHGGAAATIALKNYIGLRLQPKDDKYYLIELVDDPRGRRRRGADRLPVGQGPGPAPDRYGRIR